MPRGLKLGLKGCSYASRVVVRPGVLWSCLEALVRSGGLHLYIVRVERTVTLL